MAEKVKTAQSPLILRAHRLMEAFAKSDDERDFYLDNVEGFIIFVDLGKTQQELDALAEELSVNRQRYCLIPKLTFYEIKKIMEGFVNEKVYDIDTKEKMLDIIQSKDARDNFLEFIWDHLTELEKWQQYYQERSRIRIIEWLRNNNFQFVFEEDLDLPKTLVEKLKTHLFDSKVPKDVSGARDMISAKAKTYYSIEALNPRPKRGRPPKQIVKVEVEPQMTMDLYSTVTHAIRPFLFVPDISSVSATAFSSKYETEEQFLANRNPSRLDTTSKWENLSEKLASIRSLAQRTGGIDPQEPPAPVSKIDWSVDDDDDDDDDEEETKVVKKASKPSKSVPVKEKPAKKAPAKAAAPKKPAVKKAEAPKKIAAPAKKPAAAIAKAKPKAAVPAKKKR
jgi:hypothetical protein